VATQIPSGAALLAVLAIGCLPCHWTAARAAGSAGSDALTFTVSKTCKLRVHRAAPSSDTCWFLACKAKKRVDLGCDLTEMSEVSEVSVSPDRRWLGVISVGEGHPILEIVDLAQWLSSHEYRALKSIDPYPGTINLAGWSGTALLVSSDMPLPQLPMANGNPETYMLSPPQVFGIELHAWRIEPTHSFSIPP
jgi:hypothetical protein